MLWPCCQLQTIFCEHLEAKQNQKLSVFFFSIGKIKAYNKAKYKLPIEFFGIQLFFLHQFLLFLFINLFSCHFWGHRSNFPPVSHSTSAQLGTESQIIFM